MFRQWECDRTACEEEGLRLFGRLVRAHRRRLGLTQQELADASGLGVRSVRKIEAGQVRVPRPPTVRLLGDAFGLTGVDRDQFFASAVPGADEQRAGTAVPAQLPPDVSWFTGRDEQLARLDGLIAGRDDAMSGAVVISAVSGTAGVGKTALAVHWAHRVTELFPDGQLYVNLRGYGADPPMAAADALARFLSALGVPSCEIPVDEDDRAARLRTRLAGRRVLLVLDNASSVEQVRPLLPGTASCAVVVTSRDSLAGLVAGDGARRVEVDLLPEADAVALLRGLIGDRADADPSATIALAHLCARLPLALRVAAELATARPTAPLADVVNELDNHQRLLDVLDQRTAVTAVFARSVLHLDTDSAQIFRLLGQHPGESWDAYAVAALADTDLWSGRRMVDTLASAHLIHAVTGGRYAMHDLLRAYARGLATTQDAEHRRRAAMERLHDYYLAASADAMDRLFPAETHRRPRVGSPATPVPHFTGADMARTWLDAERTTLVATAIHATRFGWKTYAVQMSRTLYRYLDGGHYGEALTLHEHARDAAEQTGDLAGQAQALLGLGVIQHRRGHCASAIDHHRRALALFRQAADSVGQARALGNLGLVEDRLGHYQAAARHQTKALARYHRAGDHVGEAYALMHLALIDQRRGRYHPALVRYEQALAVFRSLDDHTGEAYTLNNLGNVEQRLGDLAAATSHHERALQLFRQLGHRYGQALTLDGLGVVSRSLGQPHRAIELHTQALAIFSDLGDRDGQVRSLNGLGEAAYAAGHPEIAMAHHVNASALATDTGAPDQRASAHIDLKAARPRS